MEKSIKKLDDEQIEIEIITKSTRTKINIEEEKEMLETDRANMQKRIDELNKLLSYFGNK